MNTIRMVVLDMAGTTVDENNVVYKTLHKAIKNAGVTVSLETVLEFGAGKEKHQAIKDVLSHLKKEALDSSVIFEKFKVMLDKAYQELEVSPIKGVEATMIQLKKEGIKVALNTGYNSAVANNLLNKLQWKKGDQYDALITSDDVKKGRPHPDMIFKAMELLGVNDTTAVLKAGDSAIDIEEGKNANCGMTIGVLSGAQTKAQLEKATPTHILESLATLHSVL
ncbi:MAG: phosphonatase-like hydrolase [Polaribacter sp.]